MTIEAATDVNSKPKDDQFYFTFMTFEVEGIHFRVPRHPFEIESEVFRDMFTLPSTTDESVDGSTDAKPLTLQGITAKDFRAFLRVLFDPAHGTQNELCQDEWTSVLHLSHMWNCNRLFALAISKLDRPTVKPTTKILLAKAYNINDWLRPAYYTLAMRPEPLTVDEMRALGMECAAKICEVRELRYKRMIENMESGYPYYEITKPIDGYWTVAGEWVADDEDQGRHEKDLATVVNRAITQAFALK